MSRRLTLGPPIAEPFAVLTDSQSAVAVVGKRGGLRVSFPAFDPTTHIPPAQVLIVYAPEGTQDGYRPEQLVAAGFPIVTVDVPVDGSELVIAPDGVPPGRYAPKLVYAWDD